MPVLASIIIYLSFFLLAWLYVKFVHMLGGGFTGALLGVVIVYGAMWGIERVKKSRKPPDQS